LTGIGAAITGVERLGWRALLTATAAFLGLALMLGQQIGDLSMPGLACAFGAALCRVISLLATRAMLSGTDARVTTWYSMVPSTMLFVTGSVALSDWHLSQTAWGWGAFMGVSLTSTLSTLLIYISTNTVGPFRTALMMNLEPLLTLILSMLGNPDLAAIRRSGNDDRVALRVSVRASAVKGPTCEERVPRCDRGRQRSP
jgi:drug/metabolite transporter (DMT)-like permease